MTQDFFLGQLRLIAVGLIAYAAGRGWLSTADSTLAGAILPPIGLLLGPWIWSLYVNIGKKLVPHDSVAIKQLSGAPIREETLKPTTGLLAIENGPLVKVVGALFLALCLYSSLGEARAQGQGLPHLTGNIKRDFAPTAPASSATATGNGQLDSALGRFNDGVSKIEKKVVDLVIADLNAAIKDATAHNDLISLPCWQAHLLLFNSLPSQWPEPPTLPMGIALSIQVQRDLLNSITGAEVTSLKVACAALYGDQLKIIANVGAMLGIRIATGGLL